MVKNARGLLAILALLLLPSISRAGGGRFDGAWATTVSCEAIRDALGFSYRFPSEVKDSSFRGLHGTEGKPGYLLVEGQIADDGSAELYAKGQTGSKEFVPGRDTPRGTEYGYHIKAQFGETKGTGTRVEGRPCTFEFVKQ